MNLVQLPGRLAKYGILPVTPLDGEHRRCRGSHLFHSYIFSAFFSRCHFDAYNLQSTVRNLYELTNPNDSSLKTHFTGIRLWDLL
jgi:hypothetical protein